MELAIYPPGDDILVVDDDPTILELVTELLEDEGYRVRQACDGLEAWQAIHVAPPRLLLTDLRMPFMSGEVLVTQLRAGGYDFPILLMAATPARGLALAQRYGIEFIEKPFALELLLDGVRRYAGPAIVETT